MATDKQDSEGSATEDALGSTAPVASESSPEPAAPKGMTDEESAQIKSQAADMVKQMEGASGSKELELVDSVTHVGMQAQRGAATELDLLKTHVGSMLSGGGPGEQIAKNLVDLRVTLNQINPHELSTQNIWQRILGVIPFFGRSSPAMRALQKIALRYEPISKQVSAIEKQLRDGRAMLARDNVELRKVYEQVEEQQQPVQKNAYLGELLMAELTDLSERTDDSAKRDRVTTALHDVAMRVQDLRSMETVYGQYFVSIEMTRQNNNRLGQSVERTLSLATNVVTVGLAIQAALVRQKRVMEATQRTREFLGELIAANAASIKKHTEEIGDLYNNPVIAIDKIAQAQSDLIEALDTAGRLRQEGIEAARQNIAKLNELSGGLQERALALPAPTEGASSLEATP